MFFTEKVLFFYLLNYNINVTKLQNKKEKKKGYVSTESEQSNFGGSSYERP